MGYFGFLLIAVSFVCIFLLLLYIALRRVMPEAFVSHKEKPAVTVTGTLVSKERELGISDIPDGAPGHSAYYHAQYRYMRGSRPEVFSCDVLEEPPKEISLKLTKLGVAPVGSMAMRSCPQRGRSWIAYTDEDHISLNLVFLAFIPFGFCLLAGVLLLILT